MVATHLSIGSVNRRKDGSHVLKHWLSGWNDKTTTHNAMHQLGATLLHCIQQHERHCTIEALCMVYPGHEISSHRNAVTP